MKKNDIRNELLKFNITQDKVKVTDIDELNVDLYIKPLTALKRVRILDKMQDFYGIDLSVDKEDVKPSSHMNEGHYKFMVYTLFETLVDEDDEAIFETFEEALEITNVFPAGIVSKIHDQIMKINKLDKEEEPEKKQEEDSDQTQN